MVSDPSPPAGCCGLRVGQRATRCQLSALWTTMNPKLIALAGTQPPFGSVRSFVGDAPVQQGVRLPIRRRGRREFGVFIHGADPPVVGLRNFLFRVVQATLRHLASEPGSDQVPVGIDYCPCSALFGSFMVASVTVGCGRSTSDAVHFMC